MPPCLMGLLGSNGSTCSSRGTESGGISGRRLQGGGERVGTRGRRKRGGKQGVFSGWAQAEMGARLARPPNPEP